MSKYYNQIKLQVLLHSDNLLFICIFQICWTFHVVKPIIWDFVRLIGKTWTKTFIICIVIHFISLYNILVFLKCQSHFKKAPVNKFSFTPKVAHFRQATVIGFHSRLFWHPSPFPLPLSQRSDQFS